MAIDQVLRQCKTTLRDYYGSRFQGLVLYGSFARNQADAESDIDLLVLLNRPVPEQDAGSTQVIGLTLATEMAQSCPAPAPIDYFEEIRRIVDLLYPIQLESDRLISAKPVFLRDYEQVRLQLYRSAKKEGLLV